MTHNNFAISDHHLFHANILKFVDDEGKRNRLFDSLDDMHEYMIEKNNSVVKDEDYVYWLGDVTFQYHAGFNNVMSRMKGRKRLIHGNHDKVWNPNLMRWFEKCELWKGFKEHNFTMTHMPARLDGLRDGKFNVHGHVHCRTLPDPHYINVSVEVRNYTPVSFEELAQEINKVN